MTESVVGESVVGEWPAWPEVTALVEASGAVLAWDVLAGEPLPAARIHDPVRSGEWLWEIYEGGDPTVLDACRTLAQLNWAAAWWPASAVAGVPALDPVVLHAERAVATSIVEHLLDDPDAVARSLEPVVLPEDPELATWVAALAEDHGVALAAALTEIAPARSGYALAAGGSSFADGTTVLTGSSEVDWLLVPAGAVDAAAPAEWAVLRRGTATVLEVAVLPGPRPETALAARFGDHEVALDGGLDELGRRTGSTTVPPTVLLLPPDRRTLTVYAPGFAEPAPPAAGAAERRAALLDYARGRAGSPLATRTERAAR